MKSAVILIVLIMLMTLLSGCISDIIPQEANYDPENRSIILVTEQQQIDDALKNGPVLLEFGAEWCPTCKKLAPIIDVLATEYEGNATVMYVDIDVSPDLASKYNIYSIPDTAVIVLSENGEYIYMNSDGKTETSREKARIIGYAKRSKFENILDNAIEYRARNT